MREEAIRDPLWVLADFAPRELENRAALRWAGDVLAALAPFVVLRSEMEQVGWRAINRPPAVYASPSEGHYVPVYVVASDGGEEQ